MIPVVLLAFDIRGDYPLDLGANPGSSLRGGLYEALSLLYDTNVEISTGESMDANPTAWLMHMIAPNRRGGQDVPRPIAIRPPLESVAPQHNFGIALYGKGYRLLNIVVSALFALQNIGIGRGRNKFHITSMQLIDPVTQRITHDFAPDAPPAEIPDPPPADVYRQFAHLLSPHHLRVHFHTPTRIIVNSKLCKTPDFRAWFHRLIERIRYLSELYADEPVWVPFQDLLSIADKIQIDDDKTHWREAWSGSRRDGMMKPVSGFVGTVNYHGDLAQLLPWLLIGQSLQVGKNTVKGCGWYHIEYQWRSENGGKNAWQS